MLISKMFRLLVLPAILFLVVSLTSTFANPPEKPVFIQDLLGQVNYIEGQILQLENAIPQDKFSWTPQEGIRSVAETYMHIAAANYMIVHVIKGDKMEGESEDFEKSTTDKKEIAENLKNSFADLKEFVGGLSEDDLNKNVHVFGMDFTVRSFLMAMFGHMHEHLGQSIAYARFHHITPPWSMKSDEE